jgi:hypothetical protein
MNTPFNKILGAALCAFPFLALFGWGVWFFVEQSIWTQLLVIVGVGVFLLFVVVGRRVYNGYWGDGLE